MQRYAWGVMDKTQTKCSSQGKCCQRKWLSTLKTECTPFPPQFVCLFFLMLKAEGKKHNSCIIGPFLHIYTSRFFRPAALVSYNAVPLWLLQVEVPFRVLLRVLRFYCDRNITHAIAAEYPYSDGSSHNGTASYEDHIASQEETECVNE